MADDCIEQRIELAAPIERVWRAVSDHEEFGEWFRVKLDGPFRVGEVSRGHITLPGYEHMEWDARVTAIDPPHYFAYRWRPADFPDAADRDMTETLVEFILEATTSGTTLTIRESGFEAIANARLREESLLRNGEGWAGQTQNIEAHVSRRSR